MGLTKGDPIKPDPIARFIWVEEKTGSRRTEIPVWIWAAAGGVGCGGSRLGRETLAVNWGDEGMRASTCASNCFSDFAMA
jgi:hypothetical protein